MRLEPLIFQEVNNGEHTCTTLDVLSHVLSMASLWKDQRTKNWVACFTDRDGRRLKKSTHTAKRTEALKIAAAMEDSARRARTSRKVREVIANLHREITGDDLVFPTVREYVATWLARKGPETASSTLAFYTKSTSNFIACLGEGADKPIDQITSAHITSFRNARAKVVATKTANHDLKSIRMLFKAARKDGFVFENPSEAVDTLRQRGAKNSRRPFSLPELRALMDSASPEWQSMIQFGLFTGMRLSDVASLTWANLDKVRNELRYQARKTGKVLILPIVGPLADHVTTLSCPDTPNAPLHPRAFDSLERTGRSGTLSNWFADLLADAGLRERKKHHITAADERKGRDAARDSNALSFHCLRHTAVSLLKDAGISASVVMELVGHDSSQMSEHYTHTGLDALGTAMRALPHLVGGDKA